MKNSNNSLGKHLKHFQKNVNLLDMSQISLKTII